MTSILYITHGALLLIFGVFVTGSFAGISVSRAKNFIMLTLICIIIGMLQLGIWALLGNDAEWKLYPITTHLPLAVFLCAYFHKNLETVTAAVFTAYMFCQPVKWFGVIAQYLTGNENIEYAVRIAVIVLSVYPVIRFASPFLSIIYNRDRRSVMILALMPMIYYVFDYVTIVYTDLWINNNRVAAEFVPLMLVFVYLTVTILYSNELEAKQRAEQKASIIRITDDQQKKEMEAIRRNQNEIRVMHHDMRLFLNTLSLCLEKGDTARAKELLSSYSTRLHESGTKRYCSNDTINYILSDFDAKCGEADVTFIPRIMLDQMTTDVNLFLPILTNALDNALDAQKLITDGERWIKLEIRISGGKLLMSAENPVAKTPVFSDGLPVSTRAGAGHGYGTKSISYMTERLGGKVKFSVKDNIFSVKVII